MDIARPARPAFEVVFERRVSARDLDDPLDRRRRQRRPSQVGVDDDAGRVDDRLQRPLEDFSEVRRGEALDSFDNRRFRGPTGVALEDWVSLTAS